MIKGILEANRTPAQRNTLYEPIKLLADANQPTADEAEPPSGKSKVLGDSLRTASNGFTEPN